MSKKHKFKVGDTVIIKHWAYKGCSGRIKEIFDEPLLFTYSVEIKDKKYLCLFDEDELDNLEPKCKYGRLMR